MINEKQRRAYTEIISILEELNLLDRIPKKVLEIMQRERDKSWDFTFNKNKSLEKQPITKYSAELLTIIYLIYICNSDEEKNKLMKIYEENEIKQFV